ncbi:MAG: hypothetical protein BWY02_02776 [bacterium ADurb.Bin157]|nr:MAG: hypothetical protein BWY02_02776 [bacterium ADurb.Bin157]
MDQRISINIDDEIPVIHVKDFFEFISSGNKTLVYFEIARNGLTKKYKVTRTKNGGYIMQ